MSQSLSFMYGSGIIGKADGYPGMTSNSALQWTVPRHAFCRRRKRPHRLGRPLSSSVRRRGSLDPRCITLSTELAPPMPSRHIHQVVCSAPVSDPSLGSTSNTALQRTDKSRFLRSSVIRRSTCRLRRSTHSLDAISDLEAYMDERRSAFFRAGRIGWM